MANSCWGIFRESTHSPGRESDDTEILRLTGKHLEAKGLHVELKTADEVTEVDTDRPRFVFLMCERVEVLERLRALEVERRAAREQPARRPQHVPRSDDRGASTRRTCRSSRAASSPPPSSPTPDAFPVWVKRGDVHNTQEGDVVLAPTAAAIHDALCAGSRRAAFRARSCSRTSTAT